MNNQETNEKLAFLCGWKKCDYFPTGLLGRVEKKWKSPADACFGQIDSPPNYCGDLNAMREAEIWMVDRGHGGNYQWNLQAMGGGWLSYHLASSHQRAMAAILTLENEP